MRTAYEIEKENQAVFDAYWKKRGVNVQSRIDVTMTKDGGAHSLRSDIVLHVPKIDPDGNIQGRIYGDKSDLIPRGMRTFLLPEVRKVKA